MDKVIELAREAGILLDKHNGGFVNQNEFKRFYTLARADLLAENEQLSKERQAFKDVAEYRKAENAKLRDELFALRFEGKYEATRRMRAENAKLREALERVKQTTQRGSEASNIARAALGENE